ncbi:hypothetical protein ACRQFN_02345 [Actinotignum sp. GS-2025e]|uniref:hypothetical protein n=1 Tax=unclassified Actinotignum TaxID=2632702 RepID=UPI003F453149
MSRLFIPGWETATENEIYDAIQELQTAYSARIEKRISGDEAVRAVLKYQRYNLARHATDPWAKPGGALEAYMADDVVAHKRKHWIATQNWVMGEPGLDPAWRETGASEEEPEPETPAGPVSPPAEVPPEPVEPASPNTTTNTSEE